MNSVSSSLKYSPISACLNVTIPVGSNLRASAVDLALTPNPYITKKVSPAQFINTFLSLSIFTLVSQPRLLFFVSSSTYQRRIIHTQHHHTLMLRAILAPPPHMRLEHIAAVQERHLAILLDPDLVAGVRCDYAEGGDVETEFPGFCEFSKADS